jgi:hypothetical protein
MNSIVTQAQEMNFIALCIAEGRRDILIREVDDLSARGDFRSPLIRTKYSELNTLIVLICCLKDTQNLLNSKPP